MYQLNHNRTHRPQASLWLSVTLGLLLMLGGCTSIPEDVERVPIDQLMQEAINQSAKIRAEQETMAEGQSRVSQADFYETIAEQPVEGSEIIPTPASARNAGILEAFQDQAVATDHGMGTINEEFYETDIREAISIVASESSTDVLVDDRVQGVVNVSITDATVEEALEKLLLPLGFVMGKRGEQFIICPADAQSPLFPLFQNKLNIGQSISQLSPSWRHRRVKCPGLFDW